MLTSEPELRTERLFSSDKASKHKYKKLQLRQSEQEQLREDLFIAVGQITSQNSVCDFCDFEIT